MNILEGGRDTPELCQSFDVKRLTIYPRFRRYESAQTDAKEPACAGRVRIPDRQPRKGSGVVTMKQIAAQAGVSIATVSLVLNGRGKGRVSPEVAQRVREIADELGYVPNRLASGLKTSRSHILGFVSDEIATTPYAGRLILGAQDAARDLGYTLFTVNTDGDPGSERREINGLKRYDAEGFLYARMYHRRTSLPASLSGCRVVITDASDVDGLVPSVVPDEFSIGHTATEHLIDAGCTRIAYVGTTVARVAQRGRFDGYRAALAEHGIAYDPDLVVYVGEAEDALERMRGFFAERDCDGFFCFNDVRAWCVYDQASRHGLEVGRDLSVVGVDNHRVVAEMLAPSLTTVELPHYEMGYWAVGRLVTMIEGRSPAVFPGPSFPDGMAPLPSLRVTNAVIGGMLRVKHSVVGA